MSGWMAFMNNLFKLLPLAAILLFVASFLLSKQHYDTKFTPQKGPGELPLYDKFRNETEKSIRKSLPKEVPVRSLSSKKLSTLPLAVINGIKKMVYFVGYHRSGHSIVGSLLDAHPHMVVPHEFFISSRWAELDKESRALNVTWKEYLFNQLYQRSCRVNVRHSHSMGFSLAVDGLWQGRFDQYIEVIGDKSGGRATKDYLIDKEVFRRNYLKMKEAIGIPIRVIHVVRHPLDMIATQAIIEAQGHAGLLKGKRAHANNSSWTPLDVPAEIKHKVINTTLEKFPAIMEMIDTFLGEENVLEVHNGDLVADPRHTMLRILEFLEVEASEEYLSGCVKKVFKDVSRSRDLMAWTPEELERVEREMRQYKMLDRYTGGSA